MSRQGQPLPMNQSLHKAFAGAFTAALLPLAGFAFNHGPLPDDFGAIIKVLLDILIEMLISGICVGGFVYRTTNYELKKGMS